MYCLWLFRFCNHPISGFFQKFILRIETDSPSFTETNFAAFPRTTPNGVTGLYAGGCLPVLTGVGPNKIQKARPIG